MRSTTRLRDLLRGESVVVAPGCHDALGARLIERAGFPAVYLSGNATTASLIGAPDIGLLGMSEMTARARQIASCIQLPLICDADTGYGGLQNVVRTVREYEAAGAAGIHIEDQSFPKRCGAMSGVSVVSREEACQRIKAVLGARSDPDFLLIARTDARAVHGLDEALYRAHRFAELGADIVFVEDLQSREEIERTARELSGIPLFFNVLEAWPWTVIPVKELGQMGFRIVIFCLSSTLLFAQAFKECLDMIRSEGTTARMLRDMMSFREYTELLGLSEMRGQEDQIAGKPSNGRA